MYVFLCPRCVPSVLNLLGGAKDPNDPTTYPGYQGPPPLPQHNEAGNAQADRLTPGYVHVPAPSLRLVRAQILGDAEVPNDPTTSSTSLTEGYHHLPTV